MATIPKDSHPLLQSIRSSPLTAALMSKLVEQPKNIGSAAIRDTKVGAEASMGEMSGESLKLQQDIQNAENASMLFPDIELSKQILITSILAPNNMLTQELLFKVEHPMVPPDVANAIQAVIEQEVDSYYHISSDLYRILSESLFDKGAHIRLVLPESAVDELINDNPQVKFESAQDVKTLFDKSPIKSTGMLGPADIDQPKTGGRSGYRFENHSMRQLVPEEISFRTESANGRSEEVVKIPNLTVTDNFYILRQPYMMQKVVELGIRSKFRHENWGASPGPQSSSSPKRVEKVSVREISDAELKSSLFKSNSSGVSLFRQVPDRDNLQRYSVGRPMETEVPMEAFIPVHYPGDPSRIVGGFALTDETGYFLTMETQRKYLQGMERSVNSSQSSATGSSVGNNTLTTSLLQKARNSLSGINNHVPLTYISEIFGNIVEENIVQRTRNGVYGMEMALSRNNDAYHVLLARVLAARNTRMVYIPKQFFTYFAFQYNPNGTGRSLLTDVRYLISLRAVSMYAKVANQIRNAISVTDIKIKLDERDPDPQKTLEKVVDIVTQTRSQFFPWGLNTPSDIANWWQRSGFQLNVEEHPRLPKTKIEYEFRNHDKGTPDIDDDGVLNDMIHMHFGVTPEMRDAGYGAEFATSIANNNILFSKRTQRLQNAFNDHLSNYVRVVSMNDEYIFSKIRKTIESKWGDIVAKMDDRLKTIAESDKTLAINSFVEEVIESIRAELPSPRIRRLQQQTEAFNDFVTALDAVLDAILSDDAVTLAMLDISSEQIVQLRPHLRAQLIRDWMQTESFMTEVFDLSAMDAEGKPHSEILAKIPAHLKGVAANVTKFIKEFMPTAVAIKKDADAALGIGGTDDGQGGLLGGSDTPPEDDLT